MGEIQIPFKMVSSAGADLVDPENDLVNYFLTIQMQPIAHVVERAFSNRGPRGYGASLILSRILKIKQIFISDRVLVKRLKEVATYRRLCGFCDGKVPTHSTYNPSRKAIEPEGYTKIHAGFVRHAKQVSIATGDPRSFTSYEEFFDAFRKQYAHCMKVSARVKTISAHFNSEFCKRPLASCLFKTFFRVLQGHHGYARKKLAVG